MAEQLPTLDEVADGFASHGFDPADQAGAILKWRDAARTAAGESLTDSPVELFQLGTNLDTAVNQRVQNLQSQAVSAWQLKNFGQNDQAFVAFRDAYKQGGPDAAAQLNPQAAQSYADILQNPAFNTPKIDSPFVPLTGSDGVPFGSFKVQQGTGGNTDVLITVQPKGKQFADTEGDNTIHQTLPDTVHGMITVPTVTDEQVADEARKAKESYEKNLADAKAPILSKVAEDDPYAASQAARGFEDKARESGLRAQQLSGPNGKQILQNEAIQQSFKDSPLAAKAGEWGLGEDLLRGLTHVELGINYAIQSTTGDAAAEAKAREALRVLPEALPGTTRPTATADFARGAAEFGGQLPMLVNPAGVAILAASTYGGSKAQALDAADAAQKQADDLQKNNPALAKQFYDLADRSRHDATAYGALSALNVATMGRLIPEANSFWGGVARTGAEFGTINAVQGQILDPEALGQPGKGLDILEGVLVGGLTGAVHGAGKEPEQKTAGVPEVPKVPDKTPIVATPDGADEVLVPGTAKPTETPAGASGAIPVPSPVAATPPNAPEAAPATVAPQPEPTPTAQAIRDGLRDRRIENLKPENPTPAIEATANQIAKIQATKDVAIAQNDPAAATALQQAEEAGHTKLATEALRTPQPEPIEAKPNDQPSDNPDQSGAEANVNPDEVTRGQPTAAESPETAAVEPSTIPPDETTAETQAAASAQPEPPDTSGPTPPQAPVEPPSGKAPIDPAEEIRLAHADEDARRSAAGLPEIPKGGQATDAQLKAQAAERMAIPGEAEKVLEKFSRNPGPMSGEDHALMLHYADNLDHAIDQNAAVLADPNATPEQLKDAAAAHDLAQAEREKLAVAVSLAGSKAGADFRARQLSLNRGDIPKYPDMVVEAMKAKDPTLQTKLSPEERKTVEDAHSRLAAADAAQKAHELQGSLNAETENNKRLLEEARKELADTKEALAKALKSPPAGETKPRFTKRVVDAISVKADAARERLKARGVQFNAGVDPSAIPDYAIIMAEYIAKGVDAAAEMVSSFGETIKGSLKDIEAVARGLLANEVKSKTPEELTAQLKARKEADPEATIGKNFLQKLAKSFIKESLENGQQLTRSELNDKILAVAKEFQPNITMQEARDLRTGYGVRPKLSDDPVDVRLRELNRIDQLFSSLERAKTIDPVTGKGMAGLKSGPERDKATAAVREIQRELNDAMARNGVEPGSPETQLAGRRQGIETRLKNEIEDLQRQIDGLTQTRPAKPPFQYDEDLQRLKDHRDELRKIVAETPEAKATIKKSQDDAAIAAAQKAEAEWNRRADALEFDTKAKPSPERSAAVNEARTKAKEARDRWQALKKEAERPAKQAASEKQKDDAAIEAAKKAEKEWTRRADELDFSPTSKTPAERSQAVKDARLKAAEARNRWQDLKRAENVNHPAAYFDEVIRKADAADKRIAELEAKRDRGDTSVDTNETAPTHPLLEEKRARIDQLNDELAKLRQEADRPERERQRAQNQLDDAQARIIQLEERLNFGDVAKRPAEHKAVSDELRSLREQAKGLNKAISKARNDAEKPARELKRAEKELQDAKDAVANLKAKLARGDLSLKPSPKRTIPDELKAEREKLKELNKELARARNAARVRPDPEIQKRDQFKARVKREIADLRMRRASNNFESRTRKPAQIVHDAESERLAADKRHELHAWEVEKERLRLQNREGFEKFFDTWMGIARGGKLTRLMTDAKLVLYSLYGLVKTPFQELVGSGVSKLPGLDRANTEGRFSLKALGKFYSGFFGKGMKDALQSLSPVAHMLTGGRIGDRLRRSDMKNILAESEVQRESVHLEPHFYDIPQIIHEAIKSPLRRAAFEMSVQKQVEHGEAEGLDTTSKEARAEIVRQAGRQAQRAILMGDNRWADAINRGISRLSEPDKQTGQVRFRGKAGEYAARSIATFNRVAANHFVELFNTILGAPVGAGRYALGAASQATGWHRAFGKALSEMHPDDVNSIVRQIKTGSIGAAFLTLGILRPDLFGGLGHQKRKDEDPGFAEMKLGDVRVPRVVSLANPLLLAAQIGATITHIANSKLRQKDTETQGVGAGVLAGAAAVTETGPLVNEAQQVGKLFEPGQGPRKFVSDWLHSQFEPGLVSEIAEFLDRKDSSFGSLLDPNNRTVKRKAETLLDELKIGTPGLRPDVPVAGKH